MSITTRLSLPSTLPLLLVVLFLFGGCARSVPGDITLTGGEKATLATGIVKKVNLKNNTVLLKNLDGSTTTFHLNDAVVYKAISSGRAISEGMSLEIIYRAEGENNNRVIEVKKLPDLGCGGV